MQGSGNMILKNFIAFEGIDGSGTTTQLNLLKKSYPAILLTAEPTSSATGQFLRRMLSGEFAVSTRTAAFLFAADRCEHLFGKLICQDGRLTTGVTEACASGTVVLSDRYLFSSLAYQGEDDVRDLTVRLNKSFPLPELVVYFQLSPAAALERVCSRGGKREIYETLSTLQAVSSRYDAILSTYEGKDASDGMQVVRVDASGTVDVVARELSCALLPFLSRTIGHQ